MPHRSSTQHDWHDAFAALYAERMNCSRVITRGRDT